MGGIWAHELQDTRPSAAVDWSYVPPLVFRFSAYLLGRLGSRETEAATKPRGIGIISRQTFPIASAPRRVVRLEADRHPTQPLWVSTKRTALPSKMRRLCRLCLSPNHDAPFPKNQTSKQSASVASNVRSRESKSTVWIPDYRFRVELCLPSSRSYKRGPIFPVVEP